MPMTLEEAKGMTLALHGSKSHPKSFKAGVIMLAPMITGWGTDEIVKATGYPRNAVEKVIANLVRWGVWGEDTWAAEWPELFTVPPEEMSDERFQYLAISFVLDSLVGAGEIGRTWDEQSEMFAYQKI